jgi:hypothetical protein
MVATRFLIYLKVPRAGRFEGRADSTAKQYWSDANGYTKTCTIFGYA